MQPQPLGEFLATTVQQGPLPLSEVIALILPLIEQVQETHQQGQVAPLIGLGHLKVSNQKIWFYDFDVTAPHLQPEEVRRVERFLRRQEQHLSQLPAAEGTTADDEIPPLQPAFLTGYLTWEHQLGHHDQLTDIFSVGLIFASLACGLDLDEPADVERFTRFHSALGSLATALPPALAHLLRALTELSRRRRTKDLQGVLSTLKLLAQNPQALDEPALFLMEAEHSQTLTRRQAVLLRLRNRLFDLSRRNPLLYFKATGRSLNLTVASLASFHQGDIAGHLPPLVWNGEVVTRLASGSEISLLSLLDAAHTDFAHTVLDRIRLEDRRMQNEFGFSQLRLVVAFLHWRNLNTSQNEPVISPLLLLPVAIEKRRGERDEFLLTPQSEEADVNPVVRHILSQKLGIILPESVAIDEASILEFYRRFDLELIQKAPDTTLRLVTSPEPNALFHQTRKQIETFQARTQPGRERESIIFELPASSTVDDALTWDIDLASVTLGIFNSRKMSLVRDFSTLFENPLLSSASFDHLFEITARDAQPQPSLETIRTPILQVVPCDPSQENAIARARIGAHFIIQGPPGTGKSQTITNLIADSVGRGKRVLFVCEKRAAIDVVYHRLKQAGLGHLCALIHDSQADKKRFIQDLKSQFEHYSQAESTFVQVSADQEKLREQFVQALRRHEQWADLMRQMLPEDGISVRGALGRLIALDEPAPTSSEKDLEKLPGYGVWLSNGQAVVKLAEELEWQGLEPVLGRHPLRQLTRELLVQSDPVPRLEAALDHINPLVKQIQAATALLPDQLHRASTIDEFNALCSYAQQLMPLVELDCLDLLNRKSNAYQQLRDLFHQFLDCSEALTLAQSRTTHWRTRLPLSEIALVLPATRRVESSFLGVLTPTYWKLRKLLRAAYDFQAHPIQPTWSTILEQLQNEYEVFEALANLRKTVQARFRVEDPRPLRELIERLHAAELALYPTQKAFRAGLISGKFDPAVCVQLAQIRHPVEFLTLELEELLDPFANRTFSEISADLAELRANLPLLGKLRLELAALAGGPVELHRAVCDFPWTPRQLESALLTKIIARARRLDRTVFQTDAAKLAKQANEARRLHQKLLTCNAQVVSAQPHEIFQQKLKKAELPAARLQDEEKSWKKRFNRGKRELEHEFGKVMRFRSIRDLAEGETGELVFDLKPVWLMSPLSVADTLPLDGSAFDVVIFDEASQIRLEDAIPTLFRAPQAIVVGDEMQLPPTMFFASKADLDPPASQSDESAGLELEFQTESLLKQAADVLPSSRLTWHYRSRSEALITFSNAVFYDRELLTIPDVHPPVRVSPVHPQEPGNLVRCVLDRPIGFHYLEDGVYEQRCNRREARYIAELIRQLLSQPTGLSLGVVAFSEAQQSEIEQAISELAESDPVFQTQLEAEYLREQDDQFCGLFVKNLENVQGDERDIIVLSVCYGFDRQHKMRQNFGPINRDGGEKRLNVVFSRARRHMVVVSSITHQAITNTYNDGAHCLKTYLAYAEALSAGQHHLAQSLMASFGDTGQAMASTTLVDPVVESLAEALREQGLIVDTQIGDSAFRCDLAVRQAGDDAYQLAILVDSDEYYRTRSAFERAVLHPALLEAFGWKMCYVLARDWQANPTSVLERLLHQLRSNRAEDVKTSG
ncbi:MAG: DUF4011 domain-containing protein [Acidobacteria bacterium]|nr:DUF4011 domain-containing protein [Acidobacteriota bacterium]